MNDNARSVEPMPKDVKERKDALLNVSGDVPLATGSTPAPRKLKCPCKGCTRDIKKLYCHSHCPDYDAWVAQEEARKEQERRDNTFTLSESGKRAIWRTINSKKRK